jgi:hypothetical protein
MKALRYHNSKSRKQFYRQQLSLQHNRCAICNLEDRLVIDHDHTSGLMRGLLCYKHNLALGLFSDSKELLKAAIDYLESTSRPVLIKKEVSAKLFAKQLHDNINELVKDIRFSSDRARARELSKRTGILYNTAATKIRRARIKLKSESQTLTS